MPDRSFRLKTEIRVRAHIRRCRSEGAFATVARRGDPDAGAVAIKVYLGAATARLFMQSRDLDGRPIWREPFEEARAESEIDARLEKECAIDPDLWIVEIEDREGRAFLDEAD
ncbi:MAG: DUF1491 family protein [Parvularculaceae bacterium]